MRRLTKIMGNLLLLVVAATVILAGVLLFNVASHGSRQIQVSDVPRAAVDQQGAATRLSEAIRFQTISNFLNPDQGADALRGLQAHISKSFPAFHAAAKREIVGRTIYFAFGHDEEVAGTRGAKGIAALLASRGVRLEFVLDEGLLITEGIMKGLDRPAALVGIAEKGYATLVLTAHATPGHSSMPPRQTAIGMMSAALARLEDHRLPMQIRGTISEMFDTLAPEMSGFNRVVLSNLWLFKPLLLREFEKSGPTEAMVRTTTALTIFNAGDKDNVLPGNAAASVNFRLIPGDTQASVTDHVRNTVDNDRISIAPFPGNTDPPPVTGTASPSYRMLNRTIREIFSDVIVAPGLMVAATDSRHYAGIADNIFRFSPVRANSEDLKRFHGTNERLSIEGYADMIRLYRRLIENTTE